MNHNFRPHRHVPNGRSRDVRAAALLSCLALPIAQDELKVPALLPHTDPDLKTEVWVAPLKDGAIASDPLLLSEAERRAEDAAMRALTRGQNQPVHPDHAGVEAVDPKFGPAFAPSAAKSGVDARLHHQVDRAEDGTLWVHGGTYKARFGADGAEFIPFLGSHAPQNFPVRFRPAVVSLGGARLAFESNVLPQLEGNSALYARGSFVERYDTRAGSLEQLFVFDSLPGQGELVVQLDVVSELVGNITSEGLEWRNELGAVTYSSAIAVDARGYRWPIATELTADGVTLRVPAAVTAEALLPLVIDPILANYVPSGSPTFDDYDPDTAYDFDNGRFAIIWNRAFSATDHDVWAEMFDSFGNPIASSGAYVDFTSSFWTQAKVANNRIASQFLVVAQRTPSGGGTPEIWGRTREAENTTQGVQFQISAASGNKQFPDVGGDPNQAAPTYYCVVWERVFTVGVDHDVHARLVTNASTLLGTGEILIDNSGGSYDAVPTVSKSNGISPASTQEWNIVWQRRFNANDWDIRGAQVHWNGTITQATFSVDFSGRNDLAPKASSPLDPIEGPRTYLVVYQGLDGADWDIYGRALKGATTVSLDNLSETWVSGSTTDEFSPCVDTNGQHFAVGYHRRFSTSTTDFDTYVAGVYLADTDLRVSEGPLNLAFSGTFEGNVELCARRSSGLVSDFVGIVWVDSGVERNIEGALYELRDTFGQVGASYCNSTTNSTGMRGVMTVTGAGSTFLNELFLGVSQLPLNQTVLFVTSRTQGFVPNAGGSQGNLCLGGALGRFTRPGQILNSGGAGAATLQVDLTQVPTPNALVSVLAGETWNFQGWHRDTTGGGAPTSNFTNGASVIFN